MGEGRKIIDFNNRKENKLQEKALEKYYFRDTVNFEISGNSLEDANLTIYVSNFTAEELGEYIEETLNQLIKNYNYSPIIFKTQLNSKLILNTYISIDYYVHINPQIRKFIFECELEKVEQLIHILSYVILYSIE